MGKIYTGIESVLLVFILVSCGCLMWCVRSKECIQVLYLLWKTFAFFHFLLFIIYLFYFINFCFENIKDCFGFQCIWSVGSHPARKRPDPAEAIRLVLYTHPYIGFVRSRCYKSLGSIEWRLSRYFFIIFFFFRFNGISIVMDLFL